jgi:hypothetical protein
MVLAAVHGASAATVYATDVIEANLGDVEAAAAADRYLAESALGPADSKFYSLGLDGDATYGFGTTFSGNTRIEISEVTFGSLDNIESYGEAVDVFAVFEGEETLIGRITNFEAYTGGSLAFSGKIDSLKFVDVTRDEFGDSPSFDGFDIDSISIAAIPLPATGGLLLLTGLLGIHAVRRRR